ncbi:MAG: AMIN domain-containing protein, partial [Cyanobacteria bacterium J06648_10]
MKRRLNFKSLMLGGALAAILPGSGFTIAGPLSVSSGAIAATTVEGIALRKTSEGLALTLETSGDTPQIVTARNGKVLQADIAHAQLDLAEGESFSRKNPAPGIESVELEAIGRDRVRLTVNGEDRAPISDIEKN